MELQFEPYNANYGSELRCPSCGSNYLHHEKVEIFDRGEDEEKGLHVSVENRVVKTDIDISGNPSSRRHGVKVYFSCENCEAQPVLSISQHKGNTVFDIS